MILLNMCRYNDIVLKSASIYAYKISTKSYNQVSYVDIVNSQLTLASCRYMEASRRYMECISDASATNDMVLS